MSVHSYYDILGVSRDASAEEIVNAKNALAKIYHPDVNLCNNIDTTKYMQEILEAYQVLSDPQKRKAYDSRQNISEQRIFRTFKVSRSDLSGSSGTDCGDSFASCWNAAYKLNNIVLQSARLFGAAARQERLPLKVLKKLGRSPHMSRKAEAELNRLCLQALQYISLLESAKIPPEYWAPESMNWLLICWSQNRDLDLGTLFVHYDIFVNTKLSSRERLRLHSQNRLFQNNLKKLLAYAP